MAYAELPAHGFDGFWWRCDVKHYSVADEYGEHSHTSTQVVWRKFVPIKQTPKGVWLTETSLKDKEPNRWMEKPPRSHIIGPWFVLGRATKQFALPTQLLAWEDCCQRKLRHIAGCKARLSKAESDLAYLHMKIPRTKELSHA